MYSLQRAPFLWFKELSTVLKRIGFEPLAIDLCVFKHTTEMAFIIIYVDNMLISAPTKVAIASIYIAMKEHFELKELGDMKQFLGMTISRDCTNY